MKKLLTLALIAMFGAISLTSCENDSNETQNKVDETQNSTQLNRITPKTSESQLIENAINLVKSKSIIKSDYTNRISRDSLIIIEPENPDPEDPINETNGTILCKTGNSRFGSACVWNDAGKLVHVTWKLPTLLDSNGHQSYGLVPTYSGYIVSQCNC